MSWGAHTLTLSASFGVASCESGEETGAGLLERADAAMYDAKQIGRNCVCAAPSDSLRANQPDGSTGIGGRSSR